MFSAVAVQQDGPGFYSWVRECLWGVLTLSTGLSLCSPTLQKNANLGLIGHSKLPVGVNVSVDDCLSLNIMACPGCTDPLPINAKCWDGLRPPLTG